MKEDIHQLIEQYLDGLLSAEQAQAFEARLKTDTELATAFSLRKDMNFFLQNKDKKKNLKKELEQIGDDFFLADDTNSTVVPLQKKSPFPRIAAIAATLLIILIATYWLYPRPSLYEQFAQHEPLQLNEKSNNTPVLITDIETTFNRGSYSKALPNLDQYLIKEPNDLQALLAKGICLLELNQNEKARLIFEEVAGGNSIYRWEAIWYLGLAHLRNGDLDKAKEVLRQIPKTEGEVFRKAEMLLEELEE